MSSIKALHTIRPAKGREFRYRLFGLRWKSNVPFLFPESPEPSSAVSDVEFRLRPEESLDRRPFLRNRSCRVIRNGSGHPSIKVYQCGEGLLLDCNNGRKEADFVLAKSGSRIDCYPHPGTARSDIELWLFGLVLSFWLQERGIFSLHASAVEHRGRALGFLGNNGFGKSTLAYYFLKRGHPLVSDDVMALETSRGEFRTYPACPSMHLWSRTLGGIGGSPGTLEECDLPDKYRLSLRKLQLPFARSELPIAGLFFLRGRSGDALRKPRIEPIKPAEAVFELMRYVRAASAIPVSQQGRLLEVLALLVKEVPVTRLEFPIGFEFLPLTYDQIVKALENGGRGVRFDSSPGRKT